MQTNGTTSNLNGLSNPYKVSQTNFNPQAGTGSVYNPYAQNDSFGGTAMSTDPYSAFGAPAPQGPADQAVAALTEELIDSLLDDQQAHIDAIAGEKAPDAQEAIGDLASSYIYNMNSSLVNYGAKGQAELVTRGAKGFEIAAKNILESKAIVGESERTVDHWKNDRYVEAPDSAAGKKPPEIKLNKNPNTGSSIKAGKLKGLVLDMHQQANQAANNQNTPLA